MTNIWYSNCLLYTVTSEFIRVTESLQTIFMFILELVEESKDNEELSEIGKNNHVELLSNQTERSQEIFHLHSVWKELHIQTSS